MSQIESPPEGEWPGGKIYHGGRRLSELPSQHPCIALLINSLDEENDFVLIWNSEVRLTQFGMAFCLTCVTDTVVMVNEESGHRCTTVSDEEGGIY